VPDVNVVAASVANENWTSRTRATQRLCIVLVETDITLSYQVFRKWLPGSPSMSHHVPGIREWAALHRKSSIGVQRDERPITREFGPRIGRLKTISAGYSAVLSMMLKFHFACEACKRNFVKAIPASPKDVNAE
jgi:hypothetical protein